MVQKPTCGKPASPASTSGLSVIQEATRLARSVKLGLTIPCYSVRLHPSLYVTAEGLWMPRNYLAVCPSVNRHPSQKTCHVQLKRCTRLSKQQHNCFGTSGSYNAWF